MTINLKTVNTLEAVPHLRVTRHLVVTTPWRSQAGDEVINAFALMTSRSAKYSFIMHCESSRTGTTAALSYLSMKRGMLALALITPHEYSPLFLAREPLAERC